MWTNDSNGPLKVQNLGNGDQLHMHTDDTGNFVNAAHIKHADGTRGEPLTGFEASMLDLACDMDQGPQDNGPADLMPNPFQGPDGSYHP